MTQTLFAGIEGGGTKFVCAVADESNHITAETRIPTTSPEQTLSACAVLPETRELGDLLKSLGIACFGPHWIPGRIQKSMGVMPCPKPGWAGADVVGFFKQRHKSHAHRFLIRMSTGRFGRDGFGERVRD